MSQLPKILIVDDELNIRRMLRSALPESEFELIEAASGREGVSAIASHNPDLVIYDLGLPDLDGVECIKEVSVLSTPCCARDPERSESAVELAMGG